MDVKVAISVDPKDESIRKSEKKIENNLKPTIDLKFRIPENSLKQVTSRISDIQNRIQKAFETASSITQQQSLIQGVGGKIPEIETRRDESLKESIKEQLDLRRYEAQEEVRIKREALEQKQKLEELFTRTQTSIDVGKGKLLEAEKTVTGKKLEELTGKAENLINTFDSLKQSSEKAYKQLSEDKDINKYTQTMEGLTDKTKKLRQEQLSLNRETQNAKTQFKDLGKTFLNNMKQFAAWTSATTVVMGLVNAVRKLINEFIRLEKVFVSVQMVTNYTNEQMTQLKNTYISMAKQLSTTVDDVASASDDWLRMGLSVQEANQALEAAIKLAKIAGTETNKATTMLISTMKGYKLETQDLISVVDKLSAVDMQSASSSEDLAESLSKVASVAYAAGISLDKLIAYAATIKDVTQQSAESVGTSLNSIFSRMSKVAAGVDVDDYGESLNDVDKVLKRYNISLRDTSGDMRNMEVVLEEIANKWDTLTTAEKNQISTALGGTRQRNAVVTLLNNYDEVLKLTTTSLESAGTAEKKFGIYTDSITGKIEKIKAQLQGIVEKTINSDFVKTILDITSGVLELTDAIGGLVPVIGMAVTALAALKGHPVIAVLAGIITVIETIKGIVQTAEQRAREAREKSIKQLQEYQTKVKELRNEFIKLNALTQSEENSKSLEKSWDSLTKLAKKLNIEIEGLNKTYENYLKLSGQIEQKALKEELKILPEDYFNAINALYNRNYKASKGFDTASYSLEEYINHIQELINTTKKMGGEYLIIGNERKTIQQAQDLYNDLIDKYEEYTDIINKYNEQQMKLRYLEEYTDRINSAKAAYAKLSQLDTDQAKKTAQTVLNEINTIIEEVKANYPSGIGDELVGDFEETRKNLENIINENLVGKFVNIQISNVKALQEAEEAENEALQKRLTLQEKILAVQEAQEKLAQAQNKRARVYRAGRGFVYEQDFSQVSAAQKELRSAQQSLREYRSSIKYEEEIALLQEASNEWEKLFINDEEFKKFVNDLTVTMEELGDTTEEILNWMTNAIQEFKNRNGINATETTSGSWNYFSGLSSNGLISPGGYNISGSSLGNVNMSSSNLSTGFTPVSYSTSSGNITNISIGSISLPGVTDAQGFADGLVNLSYQVGTSHK